MTFRTDHDKMEGFSGIVKNEHDNAKQQVSESLFLLKQAGQVSCLQLVFELYS